MATAGRAKARTWETAKTARREHPCGWPSCCRVVVVVALSSRLDANEDEGITIDKRVDVVVHGREDKGGEKDDAGSRRTSSTSSITA